MRVLPLFAGFLLAVHAAPAFPATKMEPLRAVYLHPAPFAAPALSPEERNARIGRALDTIRDCGLSTLLPYATTSGGGAYYPSALLPSAGEPGGDALGEIVRAARTRGLAVMPSLCVLVCGHDAPAGVLEQHPEWALRRPGGAPMGWISPANPEARAWVVRAAVELTEKIAPDGILLDYLRFPNEPCELDPAAAAAFDTAAPAGEDKAGRGRRLQRAKEDALSALAAELSAALRAKQPGIRLGLYSWGPHVADNHPVAQRWPDWARDGLIDIVNVSGYCFRNNYKDAYLEVFEKRLRDSAALLRGTGADASLSFALGVHTSHGAIPSSGEIGEYMRRARAAGCDGVAVFAWASLEKFAPDAIQAGWFRGTPPDVRDAPVWKMRVAVDFGADRGQNFGSLFEALDREGRVVAGAGFLGAYNSYYRADRHVLHGFVKPPKGNDTVGKALFPRPSEANQHYLYDAAGMVYGSDRTSAPAKFWDAAAGVWKKAESGHNTVFYVGAKRLETTAGRITVDGKDAFSFDSATGSAGSFYYAAGTLFFHVAEANSPERKTSLHACPWNVEKEAAPALEKSVVLPLAAPGEFPYSYGQLKDDVIVGSNNGGVYRFRGGAWSTLRPADPKTSFQLYTMLNYRDRLLMGHYPSGELFEVVGDGVRQIAGWPPRPEGASPRAREAQTLTLYRGDLFAGVWPWGEVWRLREGDGVWEFTGRLFGHPEMKPEVTAPYEVEMTALGEKINNLWGQRVTALTPFREGLLAATSNKNGAAYGERLAFLGGGLDDEYGAVHRLYLPGHLSAPAAWTGGKTVFELVATPGSLTLSQDGRVLGVTALPPGSMEGFTIDRVRWAEGVYGPLRGEWSGESLEGGHHE